MESTPKIAEYEARELFSVKIWLFLSEPFLSVIKLLRNDQTWNLHDWFWICYHTHVQIFLLLHLFSSWTLMKALCTINYVRKSVGHLATTACLVLCLLLYVKTPTFTFTFTAKWWWFAVLFTEWGSKGAERSRLWERYQSLLWHHKGQISSAEYFSTWSLKRWSSKNLKKSDFLIGETHNINVLYAVLGALRSTVRSIVWGSNIKICMNKAK